MQNEKSFFRRCQFYMLVALELLMAFTSLGYIHVPPISIALAYIPILFTGVLCGVQESMLMGMVFGLTSLCKASVTYALPADAAFSPVSSGKPLESLILSVGTRMLYGLLVGLLYRRVAQSRHPRIGRYAVSFVATQLQALLVYSAMGLLFPELGYSFRSALAIGPKEIGLSLLCVLIVEGVYALNQNRRVQAYRQAVDTSSPVSAPANMAAVLGVLSVLMLGATLVATAYFASRASYMLERHGIQVTEAMGHDLINLQMQFLMAMLALCMMLVVTLISFYRYTAYLDYRRELDSLTGVMGRRMFLRECGRVLEKDACAGWFMILDVDYFKEINDTFGHPTGDEVLRGVAAGLSRAFSGDVAIGRIGGDEFAIILKYPISREELESRLKAFLQSISGILNGKAPVTCSIGAHAFADEKDEQELMKKADMLLYKAKNAGRAQYQMDT